MANAPTPTTDAEAVASAMDYPEHEKTWRIVTSIVKWGIFATLAVLVALYFLVVAANGWAGILFLLLIPAAALYSVVRGGRR